MVDIARGSDRLVERARRRSEQCAAGLRLLTENVMMMGMVVDADQNALAGLVSLTSIGTDDQPVTRQAFPTADRNNRELEKLDLRA